MWESIQYVTSGLTLVAFAFAAVAWIFKSKSEERERLIRSAKEDQRADLVRLALEVFDIDTSNLTKEQKYELVLAQVKARARRFHTTAVVVCVLALFLAALSAYAISQSRREAGSAAQATVREPQPAKAQNDFTVTPAEDIQVVKAGSAVVFAVTGGTGIPKVAFVGPTIPDVSVSTNTTSGTFTATVAASLSTPGGETQLVLMDGSERNRKTIHLTVVRGVEPAASAARLAAAAPSFGQNLRTQQAALKEIRETAADICANIPMTGSSSSIELTGDAKAKLAGVVGKVADLGLEGAAKYNSQQYKGVLQQELAAALKVSNDCKLTVFNILVQRMLPANAAAIAPDPQADKAACLSQSDGAACDRYSDAIRHNCARADRPCLLRATCWEDKSRAIVAVNGNCGPDKNQQGCDSFKKSAAHLLSKDCDGAF